jgi:hypothetical protein
LNTLAVNDFLKPAAGFDNMFKGKSHLFKKKLQAVANQMNTKVFSNLQARLLDDNISNRELVSVVTESNYNQ